MNIKKINKILTNTVMPLPENERILRFVTSTESKDRDGDIIEVNGWQIENYMKNPVVLFGHAYEKLPIGKTVNIEIDTANKRLLQDIQFPTRDEYEFADTVFKLVKAGYLNTTSVGFNGIDVEPYFEGSKYIGTRYKKQELLETSIVPVPSNPEALLEARTKGIINDNELTFVIKSSEINDKNSPNSTGKEGNTVDKSIKSGAKLSAQNKAALEELHETIAGCQSRIRKFIDENCPMSDDDMPPGKDTNIDNAKNGIPVEIKEVLIQIKEALLLLSNKNLDTHKNKEAKQGKNRVEDSKDDDNTNIDYDDDSGTDNGADNGADNGVDSKDTDSADGNDDIDLDELDDPDEIDCTDDELEKALSRIIETKIINLTGGK